MKHPVKHHGSSLIPQISHDAKFVRSIVLDAIDAAHCATQKCLVAGYYLGEVKARFARSAHDAHSSVHGRNQHSDGPSWLEWLATNIPEIHRATADRWMSAAATVASALKMGPALAAIEIEAEAVPISRLLTMPEAEVPEAGRQLRQEWFDFTQGKTIKQCLAGVLIDGEDEAGMKRAINGKGLGGAGVVDRKAFGAFFARALKIALSQVTVMTKEKGTAHTRWNGWRELPAAERATMHAALVKFCEGLPAEALAVIRDKAGQELKLSAVERAGRNAGRGGRQKAE